MSRRMSYSGHVLRMKEMRNVCEVFVGKIEEEIDILVDGRIILKLILRK
jgi:hypothetical protein